MTTATTAAPATGPVTAPPTAATWLEATAAQSLALNFVATVSAVHDDGRLEIDAPGLRGSAHLAASCALQPQAGDRVACWRVAEGGSEAIYVLAVLQRYGAGAARWRLAAAAEIHAEPGRLSLHGGSEIGLQAPALTGRAERVRLQAGEGSFVFRTLETIGEVVAATVGQLRLVGNRLSTVFDQQVHHAGQHQRTTEGVDRVEAQVIQQQAGTLLHLQGENVLVNGERVVKMQGAQIHLG